MSVNSENNENNEINERYVIDIIRENMSNEKARYEELVHVLKEQIGHLQVEATSRNEQINILLNLLVNKDNIEKNQSKNTVETIPDNINIDVNTAKNTVCANDLNNYKYRNEI